MVAEVAYIGHHAVHLFGAYDSNQAQFRNNGLLDAFKTIQAGGDSALIDQILANDPGKPAGVTGSEYLTGTCASADCSGSPYSFDYGFGSVAPLPQTSVCSRRCAK
jgi:hypothetical protein